MLIDFGDLIFLHQLRVWLKEHDLESISQEGINERIAEIREKYNGKETKH